MDRRRGCHNRSDTMITGFAESTACRARVHCRACRSDDEFQRSIAKAFGEWPVVCPFRITVQNFPAALITLPSVPAVSTVAPAAELLPRPAAQGRSLAQIAACYERCDECEYGAGQGIEPACELLTREAGRQAAAAGLIRHVERVPAPCKLRTLIRGGGRCPHPNGDRFADIGVNLGNPLET